MSTQELEGLVDVEVLREIFARVSNWLMFHEWHPASYGYEQE
ncbi:MAG: hypothetical protein AAFU83_03310 [Bacteroidota bacterium]